MSSNVYTPKNSKYYYLRVSIDGKEYRESLQTTSKRVAEGFARKRIKELRAEVDTGANEWLFHTGFVKFHEELNHGSDDHGWSDKTRRRYRTSLIQIGHVLADIYEERGIDIEEVAAWEITTAEVSEFVSLRKEAEVSIATINRDLTAFAHLMASIKNRKWIETNPVREFEKQGMQEGVPDIVMPTEEGISKLADRAPGTLRVFPHFLNATGGRVTEMAMIRWSDVNGMEQPTEGNVSLTLRKTKGRKVRTITLRQAAIDVLLCIRKSNVSPYVFWNSKEDGFYRSVSNLFWGYGQETRFGSRLHDIRHKFAVERLKEGWSVYRVQRYIGHASVVTTERCYFRYLTQEEQAIALADGNVGL